MVAIAVYFVFADAVLIGQCVYYNHYFSRGRKNAKAAKDDMKTAAGDVDDRRANDNANAVDVIGEEEPLLARQRSGSITIPGSGQRTRRTTASSSGSAATVGRSRTRSSSQANHMLPRISEEGDGTNAEAWTKNSLSLLAVMAIGTLGWALAWVSGAWTPTPAGGSRAHAAAGGGTGPVGAQILGYASAVAYLGARIPQIVKNARDKSCEGTTIPRSCEPASRSS